jgi:hypothetical protein
VQTVVAILLVRLPSLRWAYYALMPVLALASVLTWQGLPSFLSAAATTLSTIGRMQTNEIVLRVLLLASIPFWTCHDLIVGSLPGLIADVLSMVTGATMLLRRSSPARVALMSAMQQQGYLVESRSVRTTIANGPTPAPGLAFARGAALMGEAFSSRAQCSSSARGARAPHPCLRCGSHLGRRLGSQ